MVVCALGVFVRDAAAVASLVDFLRCQLIGTRCATAVRVRHRTARWRVFRLTSKINVPLFGLRWERLCGQRNDFPSDYQITHDEGSHDQNSKLEVAHVTRLTHAFRGIPQLDSASADHSEQR
jgi:hypothetical protein